MRDRRLLEDTGTGGRRSRDPAPETGRLADVLSGPLADIAFQNLRVRPRQARSIESVERILSTAADMAFRQRNLGTITIEKISREAGVTPQAAYRYFKDVDELVQMGLRRVVIREQERLIDAVSARVLADETAMAKAIVETVLDTCGRLHGLPGHVQGDIFREYRQVSYDASLLMSELICRDADDCDVRHRLDVVKVSIGLTAVVAVATSFFSKKITLLQENRLEDIVADLFVSVLQSGGSSSDAFRELGLEFGVCW